MTPLRHNNLLVTMIMAGVLATVLVWWILKPAPFDLCARVPGMDNRPPMKIRSDSVIIGEFFDSVGQTDEFLGGSWPRFRGADFDNINKDTIPLSESWDTAGPPLMWKTTLGEGYAGPAVYNGRVYLLDYNDRR